MVFCFCSTLDYENRKYDDTADDGCDFNRPASDGKFCRFKIDTLENCSPDKTGRKFGFPDKKPCVFLKLNKVNSIVLFHSSSEFVNLNIFFFRFQSKIDFQLDPKSL